MRGFGVLISFLLLAQGGRTQTYPRWFLEQGSLKCGETAVGYANVGYYKDSSASQAVREAHWNLAAQRFTVVSGSQAFWATEAGTAWMGSDIEIAADSAAMLRAGSDTTRAEICTGESMIVSIAGEGECAIPDSMKGLVDMPAEEPEWVRTPPQEDGRMYAVGFAPKYYYESSSWKSAERSALLNLAKEGNDSVAAIEKSAGGSGQEVLSERISLRLTNYSVAARWYDAGNQIYYVLMSVGLDSIRKPAVSKNGRN